MIHADFHKENGVAGTSFSILSCPAIVRKYPNLSITTEESGKVRISNLDEYYLDHEDELGGCQGMLVAAVITAAIVGLLKAC